MENSKLFARHPYPKGTIIFLYTLLIIAVSLLIVTSIVDRNTIGLIFAPLFLALPIPIIYILRKSMFGKVRLDDEGVALTYKSKVLKEIKWQDMKRLDVGSGAIVFSKTKTKLKGIHYFKDLKGHIVYERIYHVSKEFCQELQKHLAKLPYAIDAQTMNRINEHSNL